MKELSFVNQADPRLGSHFCQLLGVTFGTLVILSEPVSLCTKLA